MSYFRKKNTMIHIKTISCSQVKKKDQINIESKLKTVRFIGELVKFKMFPKSECLHCMKVSLSDWDKKKNIWGNYVTFVAHV